MTSRTFYAYTCGNNGIDGNPSPLCYIVTDVFQKLSTVVTALEVIVVHIMRLL